MKAMTYAEAVDYLYTQLPIFQRVGASAYKKDLHNTWKLFDHLGHSYKSYPTIHVAGTNGKGSTSHMIASVLQESGLKVGLYTSPHLRSFRERIRVNGAEIGEEYITRFVQENKDFFASFDPSFFEITVAMAMDYFATEKVDIAVIETGLGGRLDSTNIITPVLSVITNIGWDHMSLLGDTLPEIAAEKAGIIKENIPVVIGERQEEVLPVFERTAKEKNARLSIASDLYRVESYEYITEDRPYLEAELRHIRGNQLMPVQTDLLGNYQLKNIVTVVASLSVLMDHTDVRIPGIAIWNGLRNVAQNTGLAGRWQILQESPLVIADTGHNKDGLKYVVEQLQTYSYNTLRMVIGFVNDKEIGEILRLLPTGARYYFTKADIPRALDEKEVQQQAKAAGLSGDSYPSVKEALAAAKRDSGPEDLIFVGGSTFVVAEVV
jgi:dihydrofolate synthase/folylpolyglutamate synthase